MILQMSYREAFEILGIKLTTNQRDIKRAYSQLVKKYHPEEQPEEWRRIHDAYECAIEYARRGQESIQISVAEFQKSELVEFKAEEPEFDFKSVGSIAQQERLNRVREYNTALENSLEIIAIQCRKRVQRTKKWKSVLSMPEIQMICMDATFLTQFGELLEDTFISYGCYKVIREFLDEVHQDLLGGLFDEGVCSRNLDAWEDAIEGLKRATKIKADQLGLLCGTIVLVFILFLMVSDNLRSNRLQSIAADENLSNVLICAEKFNNTRQLRVGKDSVLPEGSVTRDWIIKDMYLPKEVRDMANIQADSHVIACFVISFKYEMKSEVDVALSLKELNLEEGNYEVWQYDGTQYRKMTIHEYRELSEAMEYPYVENDMLYIHTKVYENGSNSTCYPIVITRKLVSNEILFGLV